MPKRSDTVRRWVLVDRQGRYSVDADGGQFSEELADAYVFVGRVRQSEFLRMQAVTVTVVRQTEGNS
jgi:hypothetical protein